jgi:hypothetical protein
MNSREETFVLPFYLRLMRTNAPSSGDEVWDDLVTVGRTATLEDVLSLLQERGWRPVVMGAWLSLRFDRRQVGEALLDALRESAGSLTAPPLAVAAVKIVGRDAATTLRESKARFDEFSVAALDAALESLREAPVHQVTKMDRVAFSEMMAFGERLQIALTAT